MRIGFGSWGRRKKPGNYTPPALPPPAAVGELAHRYFTVGTGPQSFNIASGFSGSGISYSIIAAPSGADLSINAATGQIVAQTTAQTSGNVTVRASNSAGYAEQTFPLFVVVIAEYTVLAREGNGTVTVESLATPWHAALTRESNGTVTVQEAA